MRIDKVVLKVKDIDKMSDYYKNVLGMYELFRDKNQVNLGTEEETLLILKTDNSIKLKNSSEANLYHIAYLLPNRKALADFLRHIIKIKLAGVGAADHLVSEAIYLYDPEGNGIEVYADRKKDKWKYRNNGEVIMDTLELNANDLYSISDQENFHIPNGSKIGHVHMQGYDIEKIKDFYENNLLLEQTSTLPNAVFLSYDGYHHHFAFNHWDHRVSEPSHNISTGLESIEYEVDRDRYNRIKNNILNNHEGIKAKILDNHLIIEDLNNIKLMIYSEN